MLRAASVFALSLTLLCSLGCAGRSEQTRDLGGPSPEPVFGDLGTFEVRDATFGDYDRADAPHWAPASATAIFARVLRGIDGHQVFMRFTVPVSEFLEACGGHCTDVSRLVGRLPALWPSLDELEAPEWFEVPDLEQGDTWLVFTSEPYVTSMGGVQVPCGHRDARGVFAHHDPTTSTATVIDFSLQWYRTGCGG